jgi:putative membrane protein
MHPAMIASWLFGLALVFTPGVVAWGMLWPWSKGAAVLAMSWFHFWLGARRKELLAGTNRLSGRQFRMMNEVPTLLMVIIVISVIVKF